MLNKFKTYISKETKFTNGDKLSIILAHLVILVLLLTGVV